MSVVKKAYKILTKIGLLNLVSDELYVKAKYRFIMGHPMNDKNPQSYTEKINWLKLHDHNPVYTSLVDKWEVTQFVRDRIGDEYIIPKYAIWDTIEQIDLSILPEQFVLKCTNDSGGIVICKDKSQFKLENYKSILERSLHTNYYWLDREWPYKNVKPRILAEQYVEDRESDGLPDYKFFCFDGKPQFMFVATGRASGNTCFDFFDMNYEWLPVKQHYPNAKIKPQKPSGFDEMKSLAEILSFGFKHVRVDFFQANGRVYFGEMTFCHFGGYERFQPESFDYEFGKYLNIDDLVNCDSTL